MKNNINHVLWKYQIEMVLFDEMDILDSEFDIKKIEVKYTAKFYDKYLKDWDGFFYDGCAFNDIAESDRGGEAQFDSVDEIISLFPEARKHHSDTSSVMIERFVSLIGQNDELILFMSVGKRSIEI